MAAQDIALPWLLALPSRQFVQLLAFPLLYLSLENAPLRLFSLLGVLREQVRIDRPTFMAQARGF